MNQDFKIWVEKIVPNQTGKTVLITEVNSGIGYYAALGIIDDSANVPGLAKILWEVATKQVGI